MNRDHNDWGYFCDMFKNWWRKQQAFGTSPQQREENLRRGGYRIVTSLDPNLQAIAMNEVTSKERIGSSYALGVVAVEPGTGKIKAAAVNRNYDLDQSQQRAEHGPGQARRRHRQQLPEHGGPAARRRRHARLPGRLDLQDLHAGRRRSMPACR